MGNIDKLYKETGSFIKPGLERIETLLNLAGKPQNFINVVHVGGTNGKGSVSRYLYSIIKNHGLKTGLYTSPHLVDFNERILINENKISGSDVERLRFYFEEIVKNNKKKFEELGFPSFFELTTAICFKYFFDNKVDIAIIEVGLGGGMDATNIVKNPLLSIITNISLDHCDILGNTLKKIAKDKSGIIKRGCPVVVGEKRSSLKSVIKERAVSLNSDFFPVNMVKFSKTKKEGFYNYNGLYLNIKSINIGFQALYQKRNLTIALLALDVLKKKYGKLLNINLKESSVKSSICKFINEGRFERVKYKGREVILDGAHNPDGIKNLLISLRSLYAGRNFTYIFSVMKDKDYKKMLRYLAGNGGNIILTGLDCNNERQADLNRLNIFTGTISGFDSVLTVNGILNALDAAIKINRHKESVIVICGSLFLIGEFKQAVKIEN